MVSSVCPATLHRVNIMRKLPLSAELGLLALLIWLLAGWLLPPNKGSSSVSQQPVSSGATSTSLPAQSELIAVPLFGKTPSQPVIEPKLVQQSQPVLKPLQIILLGTIVAGEHSAAVVSLDGKQAQKTVFVGEHIQPGVTLFHVDADAIVVEQSGRRQLVSLQREILKGAVVSEERPTATAASMADGGEGSVRPSDIGASSLQSNKQVPKVQPQVDSLARLLTQATFTPHLSDGKQDGLQISHIVNRSPFQKMGLYNGDIIRSVNGQAFNHAKQSLDLLKIIQIPGTIDFEITRAGKVQRIHFNQ